MCSVVLNVVASDAQNARLKTCMQGILPQLLHPRFAEHSDRKIRRPMAKLVNCIKLLENAVLSYFCTCSVASFQLKIVGISERYFSKCVCMYCMCVNV